MTTISASAPARVNIIGEHLDYNGGEVFPMAIDRRTTVSVRALPHSAHSRVSSTTQPSTGEFDGHQVERTGQWWDYVTGIVREMRKMDIDVPPLDIAVSSDIPSGAGLSSSAALEVATAAAINALVGAQMSPRDLALLAWRVETEFVGVACGIMDQFASACGHAEHGVHLWCDTGETEYVPMQETVLIFDTQTPRSLRSSAFNQRRAECVQAFTLIQGVYPELRTLAEATPEQVEGSVLPDLLYRRAMHVSRETQRVRSVVAALKAGHPIPGELLYESHESLRTLYECSSPELDWFVTYAATMDGIRGARLTGAGWGGCAIAVGQLQALQAVEQPLCQAFERTFGHAPRTWISAAADGVTIL
jgi:galactokinase